MEKPVCSNVSLVMEDSQPWFFQDGRFFRHPALMKKEYVSVCSGGGARGGVNIEKIKGNHLYLQPRKTKINEMKKEFLQ